MLSLLYSYSCFGQKYIFLLLHFYIYFYSFVGQFAMQGAGGITVKKTGQALIFGIYDEPLTPGQCNIIVERLGDYLIDQGL